MGMAHLIWVYEDGIEDALIDPQSWKERAEQVGEAVLQVTLSRHHTNDRPTVDKAGVGSHANCVQHCDHVHSGNAGVYLWLGNCLRRMQELDENGLATLEEMIAKERRRRGSQGTPT